MNMWLQWLIAYTVKSRGKPLLGPRDVASTRFRVLPTDIDLLRHMNNGRYPSYMDLARVDMTVRGGMAAALQPEGIYAVVGQATLAYRRSLQLWQPFEVQTAAVGMDERAVYLEQRFVADGEIYARGIVQGRFLQRGAGTVRTAKLVEVLHAAGVELDLPQLDGGIAEWARRNALPPARASAPSEWGGRTPR